MPLILKTTAIFALLSIHSISAAHSLSLQAECDHLSGWVLGIEDEKIIDHSGSLPNMRLILSWDMNKNTAQLQEIDDQNGQSTFQLTVMEIKPDMVHFVEAEVSPDAWVYTFYPMAGRLLMSSHLQGSENSWSTAIGQMVQGACQVIIH